MDLTSWDVDTAVGVARVHEAGSGDDLLVLGHGAGGGLGSHAPDLLAATRAAVAEGWRAVLVEQPWRLQGKKVAAPPPRLDLAWVDVLATLDRRRLVVGGRSAGARVACRTAALVGADAVLCLAFPLHPPGRPDKSRLDELRLPTVPVLVVQGDRDAFGVPPGATVVPGADHGFRVAKGLPPAAPQVEQHVRVWLASHQKRTKHA